MKRLLLVVVLASGCAEHSTQLVASAPSTSTSSSTSSSSTTLPATTSTRRVRSQQVTTTSSWPVGRSALLTPTTKPTDVRRVSSTAYCLTGTMASGKRVYRGAVAMNGVPLGSRWRVRESGQTYTVEDRIGHSSQFDIAMPGDCAGARRYGRRTVTIERVG